MEEKLMGNRADVGNGLIRGHNDASRRCCAWRWQHTHIWLLRWWWGWQWCRRITNLCRVILGGLGREEHCLLFLGRLLSLPLGSDGRGSCGSRRYRPFEDRLRLI